EVHVDRAGAHVEPGPLRAKRHGDPLVRLNAQRDDVRIDLFLRRARKQGLRRRLEVHRYLGQVARETLAGADIKRHAGPTPVRDAKLDGRIRFSNRVVVDVWFFTIARNFFVVDLAWSILPSHRALGDLFRGQA